MKYEPWSVEVRNVAIADTGDYDGVVEIKDTNGQILFQNWNGDEPAEANARRIVACVNACAGLPTELIEQGGFAAVPVTTHREVRQQRDQLLAAVRITLAENGHLADGDNCTLRVLRDAVEAIDGTTCPCRITNLDGHCVECGKEVTA